MSEEKKENELSQPPVIDIEALLKPVSKESPSGEYLRYAGIYDEIGEARRADDPLMIGDAGANLKTSDFKKVIELSVPTIEQKSKDLQIASWLAEALIQEFGFAGLRDGLKLLSSIQDKFWDTLFPEVEEGDMEGRANAIAWLDREGAFALKSAPITSAGFGFMGFEDSKRFDIPDNIEALGSEDKKKAEALKKQAEAENRTTTSEWNKAVVQSRRAFYEELDVLIEECKAEIKELDRVVEEKFDRNQAPGLNELKKQIETIQRETNKLLEQKRAEEPDPLDEIEEAGAGESAGGGKSSGSAASGAIQNRRDALRKLIELSEFFKRTEPHSPVSYLVSRAVKWGNMPLESWLQDVIKDPNILAQIRQTLGFNTESSEPLAANVPGSPAPPADPGAAPQNPPDSGGGGGGVPPPQ